MQNGSFQNVICSKCGQSVSASFAHCPYCGSPISKSRPQASEQYQAYQPSQPPEKQTDKTTKGQKAAIIILSVCLAISLVGLFIIINSLNAPNPTIFYTVKHKVKTVTDADGVTVEERTFDEYGNVLTVTNYKNGELQKYGQRYQYEYNAKHQVTKETAFSTNAKGEESQSYTIEYKYNNDNKLVNYQKKYKDSEDMESAKYSYSENKVTVISEFAEFSYKSVYETDSKGNLIRSHGNTAGGDQYDYRYEYDEDNNLLKSTMDYNDRYTVCTYYYDVNGVLLSGEFDYKDDGYTETVEYECDENGYIIKKTEHGSDNNTTVTEYDGWLKFDLVTPMVGETWTTWYR